VTTFTGHVVSEAVQVPDASETTADLVIGDTVIPIARADEFHEGTHLRIDGEVYAYDDELIDDGEESGAASVTIEAPGLVADVAEGTTVESWNPSARDGAGDINCEWKVQVAPDGDDSPGGHTATLAENLIPTTSGTMPLVIGDAVTVEPQSDGSWLVVNKLGTTPGLSPAFFVSGGIGTDTVVWAGTDGGRRAQLDGVDGALEAFNDANEQTVNLDGETNYVEGTLATGADGSPRVVIGTGALGLLPAEQVSFPTENADEIEPAVITVLVVDAGGEDAAQVIINAPDWEGGHTRPQLDMQTGTATNGSLSSASLNAELVSIEADQTLTLLGTEVVVDGALDATMRDGSVGTGTFAASGVSYAADQETANRVTSGVEVFSRETAATTTAMTTGVLRLTYFTAYADMTVASLKTATGATAAATPTTCKMGLYSIDGSGNLTRIGITANDTTVWNATTTAFTKALTSSVAITKGTRYVFAALYVGTTAPVLVARTVSQAIGNGNNRLMGSLAAQTDIPASITAGSVAVAGVQVYGELLP
jgi:hypothetical protein